MHPWTIRRATAADAEAIAHVHNTMWHATYTGQLSDAEIAERGELLIREGQWRAWFEGDAPEPAWVGTVPDEAGLEVVVGFVATRTHPAADEPRELELLMLYTLTSTHGTGLGQGLVETALGDRPAFVWVLESNARAIAFYRKLGFVEETPRVLRTPRPAPPFDLRLVR